MENTSLAGVLLNLIGYFAVIMTMLGIFAGLPLVITSIVFFVKSSDQKDETLKKKYKKRGIFLIASPFVLVIGGLLLYMVVSFLKALIAG